MPKLTQEQKKFISENFNTMSATRIAKTLNVSYGAVKREIDRQKAKLKEKTEEGVKPGAKKVTKLTGTQITSWGPEQKLIQVEASLRATKTPYIIAKRDSDGYVAIFSLMGNQEIPKKKYWLREYAP